jgi:hypothetical protein
MLTSAAVCARTLSRSTEGVVQGRYVRHVRAHPASVGQVAALRHDQFQVPEVDHAVSLDMLG